MGVISFKCDIKLCGIACGVDVIKAAYKSLFIWRLAHEKCTLDKPV